MTIRTVRNAVANALAKAHGNNESGYFFTTAGVAAIIRAKLKHYYPGTKFYVNSHNYAGGSSIRVSYNVEAEGAPEISAVSKMVKKFETSGFDGMVDYAYTKDLWVTPDGEVSVAFVEGSEGTGGVVPAVPQQFKPHPAAIKMRGGVDYVFTERRREWE